MHAPNEAHWNITGGAFHNKIFQVPKGHIADSLILFSYIRTVEKMLELYGTNAGPDLSTGYADCSLWARTTKGLLFFNIIFNKVSIKNHARLFLSF